MKYNSKLKIIGIGSKIFDRLYVQDLLENLFIITPYKENWVEKLNEVTNYIPVDEIYPDFTIPKSDSKNLLDTDEFEKIYKSKFRNVPIFTYKKTSILEQIATKRNYNLIGNSSHLFHKLEHKAEFRRELSQTINIPDFEIIEDINQISDFDYYKNKFKQFVIQDSILSSGRGTFIIKNKKQFLAAIKHLQTLDKNEIVISKFIEGKTSSIQMCMTKYGLLHFGVQDQIVSCDDLTDTSNPNKVQFAGGYWNSKLNQSILSNPKFQEDIRKLSKYLYKVNYKGTLGGDIIITEEGEIYFIEINARITGMTPIIDLIQRELNVVRFTLLHILEHTNSSYEIDLSELNELFNSIKKIPEVTYIQYYNKSDKNVTVRKEFLPGIYNISLGKLKYLRPGYTLEDIKEVNEIIIADTPNLGHTIKPGGKLLRIISKFKDFLSDENRISERMISTILQIEQTIF